MADFIRVIGTCGASGPYAVVAAKARMAMGMYAVVVLFSIVIAVTSDSLALRLNAFMGLHGIVVLLGSLLALGVCEESSDPLRQTAVLGVLGLEPSSAVADTSCEKKGCGGSDKHRHDHAHRCGDELSERLVDTQTLLSAPQQGCGGGANSNYCGGDKKKRLTVADQCRSAYLPSGLSRIPTIFHYAADVIVFFTAFSTVVEAFQRLGGHHHHEAAPSITHLVACGHIGVALYHYLAVIRWTGGGRGGGEGRRSPFTSALGQSVSSAMNDALTMLLSPAVCSLGTFIATISGHHKVDVLVALLLSVYCGQWSLRRLVGGAHILAARSPLVCNRKGGGGRTDKGSHASGGSQSPLYALSSSSDALSPSAASTSLFSPMGSALLGGQQLLFPSHLGLLFQRAHSDVKMVRGVLEVKRSLVWPITASTMGAHLHILLSRDADEDTAGAEVRRHFSSFVTDLFVECERQSFTGAMLLTNNVPLFVGTNISNVKDGYRKDTDSYTSTYNNNIVHGPPSTKRMMGVGSLPPPPPPPPTVTSSAPLRAMHFPPAPLPSLASISNGPSPHVGTLGEEQKERQDPLFPPQSSPLPFPRPAFPVDFSTATTHPHLYTPLPLPPPPPSAPTFL